MSFARSSGSSICFSSNLREPVEPDELREHAQNALFVLRYLPVRAGHDPSRGPLEDDETPDPWLYRRDYLNRRGPRTDDGDALACEVVFVVPAARVERLAPKAVQPPHVGEAGFGERPGARYEHV